MNNLIEKVEALREKEDETIQGRYSQSKNDMLDVVLEILKAELEPKDQPDSEGWWWNGKEFVDVIFIDTPECDFYAYWDVNQNVICETGKWVKAIVPD